MFCWDGVFVRLVTGVTISSVCNPCDRKNTDAIVGALLFGVPSVQDRLTWWQLRDRALQLPLRVGRAFPKGNRLALLFSLVRFLFQPPAAITALDRPEANSKSQRTSTAASLLASLETFEGWAGDDLEECREEVKRTRSLARFDRGANPFE